MHIFRCRWNTGQVVYLRTHGHREPGIISAVTFSDSGGHYYTVSWGDREESSHAEGQLSEQFEPIVNHEEVESGEEE
jgi:hypothetical protein